LEVAGTTRAIIPLLELLITESTKSPFLTLGTYNNDIFRGNLEKKSP
jgi:hypothetical protein